MNKCDNCGVIIRDASDICPLCHCVTGGDISCKDTYPNILLTVRKLKRISHIYLFFWLLTSAILLMLNFRFYSGTLWSLIPISALAYIYLILRFAIISQNGYRSKIFILVLFAVLFLTLIDWVTGFRGWSLDYVLPSGLMLVDLIIVFMMIINVRSWQSYIPLQLFTIVISLSPVVLWYFKIITHPLLSLIAFCISFFLFLGTLIIGDRKARLELKRRFHI